MRERFFVVTEEETCFLLIKSYVRTLKSNVEFHAANGKLHLVGKVFSCTLQKYLVENKQISLYLALKYARGYQFSSSFAHEKLFASPNR